MDKRQWKKYLRAVDEQVIEGLSVVRQAQHPKHFEGLREHYHASLGIAYVTVFANRSTKAEDAAGIGG
jgi:hypothetical protein